MLAKVRIKNYKCLRDVTLDLEPLTVLVGPNSSGKSSILGVFELGATRSGDIGDRPGLELVSTDGERLSAQSSGLRNGRFEWIFPARPADQESTLPPTAQMFRPVLAQLQQPNQVKEEGRLDTAGGNLANLFATLTRSQQGRAAKLLIDLVPYFADVDVRPTDHGYHQLRFQDRWNPERWYTPAEVSDGTLLCMAVVLIQFQPKQVDLLLCDDFGHGLHPYLLRRMVTLLRDLSRGRIGSKPVQVVLATHSADLLNACEPREVRFVTRDRKSGNTRVKPAPIDSATWAEFFSEYDESLGDAWLSGSLGGVPGS